MSCNNRIVCPGSDSPFANLSSEDPDPLLYIGVNFCGWYTPLRYGPYPKIVFGTESVEDSDLQAAALCPVQPVGFFSPVPVGPPPAYPDPRTQCLADCDQSPNDINFVNTAQSCEACCSPGPCVTFTMDAGKIQGRTQEEADFWAKSFACRTAAQLALIQCPGATCITIDGVLVCQPESLVPPYSPPAAIAIFWNSPQSCEAQCPDGTINVFTVSAGRFSGRNQLQADTAAASYACRLAYRNRFCVTDLAGSCCLGSSPTFTISAFGGSGTVGWSIVSGALPGGLVASVSGRTVTISGTTTTAGDFTFGLKATDALGHSVTKSFTITVVGITNDFELPTASQGSVYNTQLNAAGGTGPYTFTQLSGVLPAGITLSSSGLLSGTVTESVASNYGFAVQLTDASGRLCAKSFNIFVSVGCLIVDSSPLPAATQNVFYSHQLTVSGGTPPYTFTKKKGTFPTEITMSSSGLISGTPTSGTDTKFTAEVVDSSGPPIECFQNFTLPVIPAVVPKKYRIKNYLDGATFSTASCTHLLPPQGEPIWDGRFPFSDSGNFLATITPTNFVYQVLVNGLNMTNLALSTSLCFGGPEWQLCLVIDSAIGCWGGKLIGSTSSDSPVGIYTRFGAGCATGPATIEIEEYT